MDEFLNAKSMITPGIAGAVAMLISNAICYTFSDYTYIRLRYVCLASSFLVGAVLACNMKDIRLPMRSLYWVVNSLIIFSVGIGTSNIGANIAVTSGASNHAEVSTWIRYSDAVTSVLSGTGMALAEVSDAASNPVPNQPPGSPIGNNVGNGAGNLNRTAHPPENPVVEPNNAVHQGNQKNFFQTW
jgi:hypothetical protein